MVIRPQGLVRWFTAKSIVITFSECRAKSEGRVQRLPGITSMFHTADVVIDSTAQRVGLSSLERIVLVAAKPCN